jgi:hypothetical protein
MRNISRLIEIVVDETSQSLRLELELLENGWRARLTDQEMVVLCAAGEHWLHTYGHPCMESALIELDRIVEAGFDLAKSHATQQ